MINLLLQEIRGSQELFIVGSYHCNMIDLTVVLCMTCLLLRFPHFVSHRLVNLCLLALLGLVFVNFVRGVYFDLFRAAISERQQIFLLIFGLVLMADDSNAKLKDYIPPLLFGAAVVMCVYMLRRQFGSTFMLKSGVWALAETVYGEGRFIDSESTMVLVGVSLMTFHLSASSKMRREQVCWGLISFATFAVMILSRQRTASIAGLLGFIVYFILRPGFFWKISLPIRLGMVAGTLLVISAMVFVGPERAYEFLPQKYRASAERRNTIDARQAIWNAALFKYSTWSTGDQLIGAYAGQPYDLIVKDRQWDASVHNTYIGVLLRYGAVGLLIFLCLLGAGAVPTVMAAFQRQPANALGLPPELAVGWITIMVIYGNSYEWRDAVTLFILAPMATWAKLTPLGGARARYSRPTAPRYRGPGVGTPVDRASGG